MGLHAPTTHEFIDADDGRREQYTRARAQRGEFYQEEALNLGRSAATGHKVRVPNPETGAPELRAVDPKGLAVYLDAIKWAVGRMAPKEGPVHRVAHSFEEGDVEANRKRMADLMAKLGTAPPADAPQE